MEIKTYIEGDVSISYILIEELTVIAGMNGTKLQSIFQQINVKTIHDFVIES